MMTALPNQMHYVLAREPGEADALMLTTGPLPVAQDHDLLIRVLVAGVNRPDIMQRRGLYPPPAGASPIIGLEVAGEVVAVGRSVTLFKVGDRVTALTNGGGYAEYCTAPATQCLPWPTGFDAIQAGALPETYFTVWANLFQHGRLTRGESVLIHGGTSGIGVTALQLAREFGACAYVTVGSEAKALACMALGADAAINYKTDDFSQKIAELTAGAGVNVIIDIVGAPYFARNLACLSMDGRLVQVATMHGSKVEQFDLLRVMQKRLVITGSTMRPRSNSEKAALAQALRERVWPVLSAGRCKPQIYATFPLKDAAKAHALMESSQHIGKIMLEVAT